MKGLRNAALRETEVLSAGAGGTVCPGGLGTESGVGQKAPPVRGA